MGYLRAGKKNYSEKPVHPAVGQLVPVTVELKQHPEKYGIGKYQGAKVLHFPLLKNDLLVPQLTLREIAWTIVDWGSKLDRHERQIEEKNLFESQRLSALEKQYVFELIPKLVEQELRAEILAEVL